MNIYIYMSKSEDPKWCKPKWCKPIKQKILTNALQVPEFIEPQGEECSPRDVFSERKHVTGMALGGTQYIKVYIYIYIIY